MTLLGSDGMKQNNKHCTMDFTVTSLVPPQCGKVSRGKWLGGRPGFSTCKLSAQVIILFHFGDLMSGLGAMNLLTHQSAAIIGFVLLLPKVLSLLPSTAIMYLLGSFICRPIKSTWQQNRSGSIVVRQWGKPKPSPSGAKTQYGSPSVAFTFLKKQISHLH